MKQYLELLKTIRDTGYDHDDRTGTGRRTIIGGQLRFKMSDGLPIVTTRSINTNVMIKELLWFLSGDDNADRLDGKIWDNWKVSEEHVSDMLVECPPEQREELEAHLEPYKGRVGPIYGPNWRNASQNHFNHAWPTIAIDDIPKAKLALFKAQYAKVKDTPELKDTNEELFCQISYRLSYDQINELVINLRDRPYSSRHVVSVWIPENLPFESISPQRNVLLDKGALAPCHMMFQCFVKPGITPNSPKRLSLLLYLRSSDTAVGLPYNIGQYAILLHLLAKTSDYIADELIVNTGDSHVYKDHLEFIDTQLARNPMPLPTIEINDDVESLFDYTPSDIKIVGYKAHTPILYPVSI